ncbi:MAG: HDOD domain-containing protein [Planctomycetes bacterium]|nr:HDOD domain-containing protein [Planctomycetota bacterium]
MAGEKRKKELAHKITDLIHRLPLFPHNIDKLLSTAVKPSEDNKEILRLIESDPELRTELLQMARSYYGTVGKIETIEDAVHHVGLQALVQLIGISYARNAIQEEFAALKYLNEYIDHSEDISISCRILAEICGMSQDQLEIYTIGGQIHDIGRLAIMVASNRINVHVLGTLWDRMVSVVQDEKLTLGTDHCDVGMRICRKWNFSSIIQEGVFRHHTPLVNSDFSVAGALIFISHFLSVSDPSGEILSSLLASEVLAKLNLAPAEFDKARNVYKSRAQNSIG